MDEEIYTVSDISNKINDIVRNYIPPVWVEGEVSNYYRSRSGHIYFSLKDENALINCVIWSRKADRISFKIKDGLNLAVYGDITTYKAQSEYQIQVEKVKSAGKGQLFLEFQKLKKKLSEEGLFKEKLKQEIPNWPDKIGVVTSAEGAAIRDILNVSVRRNPSIEFIIYPSLVQGSSAADTIIKGIQTFNQRNNVDMIIIGRGGGSLEDLWAFNEEKLVRAIVESDLPIVSAVGHEVDFTLSDFAADKRVPTPSAAAEVVVPSRTDLLNDLDIKEEKLENRAKILLARKNDRLNNLYQRLKARSPTEIIKQLEQNIDNIERQLIHAIQEKINHNQVIIDNIRKQLKSMNPKEVLERGYSIVYKDGKSEIIKSIEQVEDQDKLDIEVSDGTFGALVEQDKKSNYKE